MKLYFLGCWICAIIIVFLALELDDAKKEIRIMQRSHPVVETVYKTKKPSGNNLIELCVSNGYYPKQICPTVSCPYCDGEPDFQRGYDKCMTEHFNPFAQ